MFRLLIVLIAGLAVLMTSASVASAGPGGSRYGGSTHRTTWQRMRAPRPYGVTPGFEYRYLRGRSNTAASYTRMFGI